MDVWEVQDHDRQVQEVMDVTGAGYVHFHIEGMAHMMGMVPFSTLTLHLNHSGAITGAHYGC